jgi:hypothetical protein
MNRTAAAFLDFWTTHWWELYLGALLLGLASSGAIATWSGSIRWERRYAFLVRGLLVLGTVSMLLAIMLTVVHHHDSPWEGVCFLYDHHLGFFVIGSVLPLLLALVFIGRTGSICEGPVWSVWLNRRTFRAARIWIAVFYIACGVNKFLTRETLDFFHSSGYSTSFFYFIAAWELGWAAL